MTLLLVCALTSGGASIRVHKQVSQLVEDVNRTVGRTVSDIASLQTSLERASPTLV